ncbi:MAG: hypothetical protein RSD70_05595, partial [Acidaminococcaceae bacterium]
VLPSVISAHAPLKKVFGDYDYQKHSTVTVAGQSRRGSPHGAHNRKAPSNGNVGRGVVYG